MGLVKTRRLAAMQKQQRANTAIKTCLKVDLSGTARKEKSQGWCAKWEKGSPKVR